MTVSATIGLVLCAASTLGIAAALCSLFLQLHRVTEHARRVGTHPVVASWSAWRAREPRGDILDVERLRRAAARVRRAAVNMARANAASVRLVLDIDRVAFAVRLVLETFVPSLKGSIR